MITFTLCLMASFFVLSLSLLIVPDFRLENLIHLILGALIIGILNFIITPLLLALNLRIKVSSMAIFTFLINLLILNLTTGLIDDFSYVSLSAALFGAGLLAFFQVFLDYRDPDRRNLIT